MHTVICAFDDLADAQRAMDRLVERGFSRDMIHLQGGHSSGSSASSGATSPDDDSHGFFHRVGQFFSELFGGEDSAGDAGHYTEAVRRGGTVLLVDAVDGQEADKARSVMEEMGGAIDMQERTEQWRQEGWTGAGASSASAADTGLDAMGAAGGVPLTGVPQGSASGASTGMSDSLASGKSARTTTGAEQVMPVVEEELKVGKRSVDRGGVRVVQRVVETPVKELVRLREERAMIDRRPVDRPATEADLSNFKEGSIEVRERAEEAVVSKSARVVEEVVVGKDVQEREQTVSDTVRRTEVEVEQIAGERGRSTSGTDTVSATGGEESLLHKAGRKLGEGAREVKDTLTPDKR
jgi:uncharacterized protein (TIGR02271 family)